MKTLQFRCPAREVRLRELLARALPRFEHATLEQMVADGHVRRGSTQIRRLENRIQPGELVKVDVAERPWAGTLPRVKVLAQGADWVVVDKPAGLPSHPPRNGSPSALDAVAHSLGREVDSLWPVHRLDAEVSGVWLLALDKEAAARLSVRFEAREVKKTYHALTAYFVPLAGEFDDPVDGSEALTRYHILERRGDVALVELQPLTGRTHQLRRHLSTHGTPILGDTLYSGVIVGGGLHLRSMGLQLEEEGIDVHAEVGLNWPSEPPFIRRDVEPVPSVVVSDATLRAMNKGHPWVLTDTETGEVGRYLSGTRVRLASPEGAEGPWVLTEGTGIIAARLWSRRNPEVDVEDRVERALERRRRWLTGGGIPADTDIVHLIHGEADGLPGVLLDRLGPCLRVILTGRAAEGLTERLYPLLKQLYPDLPLLELVHLRDLRRGETPTARLVHGELDQSRVLVGRESGLQFALDPWQGPAVGFFHDQRDNRQKLLPLVRPGQHWVNLFAHTGAFSASLLRAGAEVTSVDLSKPYLDILEENLQRNSLGEGHHTVKRDVRNWLDQAPARFDGLVLDPPTAAAAGQRFWSSREGLLDLITRSMGLLHPGGHLLVTRNDRKRKPSLRDLATLASHQLGRKVKMEDAPPSVDFPHLNGFPEGDPFEGLLIRVQ